MAVVSQFFNQETTACSKAFALEQVDPFA